MSDFQMDPFLASIAIEQQPKGFGEFNAQFNNMNWLTPPGRVLFESLTEPRAFPGEPEDRATYNVTLAFNPETVYDLNDALNSIAKHVWPNGQTFRHPLMDGDEKYQENPDTNERYRGLWYINAKMKAMASTGREQRPLLFDENCQPCGPEKFHSGVYARAAITLGTYTHKLGGRGIGTYLNWAMFVRKGAPLTGGFSAMAAAAAVFNQVKRYDADDAEPDTDPAPASAMRTAGAAARPGPGRLPQATPRPTGPVRPGLPPTRA